MRSRRAITSVPMAKRTLVNVNFPDLASDEVKGVRVARQGFHDYDRGSLIEGTDPRGRPYFWFGLQEAEHTLDASTMASRGKNTPFRGWRLPGRVDLVAIADRLWIREP